MKPIMIRTPTIISYYINTKSLSFTVMVICSRSSCLFLYNVGSQEFCFGKIESLVNRQQSTIKTKTNPKSLQKKKFINFGNGISVWAIVCHLKCNSENYRHEILNLIFSFIVWNWREPTIKPQER